MKKTALQSMRVGVKKMAFLTRELFGTFEKRAPGLNLTVKVDFGNSSFVKEKKNENNEKKWKKKQFWDTSNLSSRKYAHPMA